MLLTIAVIQTHVRRYIVNVTGHVENGAKDIVDRGWGEFWIHTRSLACRLLVHAM